MPGPPSAKAIRHSVVYAFDGDANPAAALHGVRAVDQQVLNHDLQHLGIGRTGGADPAISICTSLGVLIALEQARGHLHQRHDVDRRAAAASAAARTAAGPSSSRRARRCGATISFIICASVLSAGRRPPMT